MHLNAQEFYFIATSLGKHDQILTVYLICPSFDIFDC